jgi:PQQ system protein
MHRGLIPATDSLQSMQTARSTFAIIAIILACASCDYVRLLRPSVLRLLNPRMVALVNELPNVDQQNKEIIGQLFAQGGLGHAVEGRDGVMRITIRIPSGQLLWHPAVVVMPHIGKLEVEFQNDDQYFHLPYLPSNGDRQVLELPTHTAGRVQIELDEPGYYTFQDAVANFAGRGMLGAIRVAGDVPASAKLDRPPQRRPGR